MTLQGGVNVETVKQDQLCARSRAPVSPQHQPTTVENDPCEYIFNNVTETHIIPYRADFY